MKLNKIERLKLELKPYLFYEKLDKIDPSKITEADRFYLKNFGIYNTKLNPELFMLRIRVPGGRIKTEELDKITELAERFGAKVILTARAQIELHSLDFRSVLEIFRELERAFITTWQTLTDNFRNIVTDPLDGAGVHSVFEAYPIILKMQSLFLKNPSFVGLIPRKFNTAVSAVSKSLFSFFGNDCYFALAKKDGVYGFNLYLGGKNFAFAKDFDIFVKREEAVKVFKAVIKAYLKYGLRENRNRARLYHLLESVGVDGFKDMMREFYEGEFEKGGELSIGKYESKEGWFLLKDGRFAYRYETFFGEIDLRTLRRICDLSKERGYEIRIGADQNLYVLGLKERSFPFSSLSKNANVLSCAGSRYCIYSLFDTKKEALNLPIDRIESLKIKIGYSGCLKGCGRHISADIGFVGIRTTVFGKLERGVRVYLGGVYTKGKIPARLIYWAIPLRGLSEFLEVIFDEFENSGFDDFEDFSEKVLNGYRAEFLAFWFLAKFHTGKKVYLRNKKEKELLEEFKEFDFYEKIDDDLYEVIKYLEKNSF